MKNPSLVGLYIGVAAGLVYFLYAAFLCKCVPRLSQVAVVILSWAGAVVGFHLGYVALTVEDYKLGVISDQRIAIVLGSLAIVWTAIETFVILVNNVRDSNEKANKTSHSTTKKSASRSSR